MELTGLERLLATAGNLLSGWQRDLTRSLSAYLRQAEGLDTGVLVAAAFAFALGMLHAATPGHGKIVVFSYFFGQGARPWTGILTSLRIAGTHIATAIVLFLVADAAQTVFFGRVAGPALYLQAVSYLAIAAIGAVLLYRSWQPATLPDADASVRSGAFPIVVGMLPCPLTLLILSYAMANASLAAGLALVGVMGIGIAATLSLVALLAILARHTALFALSGPHVERAMRGLEIASAATILLAGTILFIQTIR